MLALFLLQLDAAWALTNIAAGDYLDAEAVCCDRGAEVMVELVGSFVAEGMPGAAEQAAAQRSSGGAAVGPGSAGQVALVEQSLWALANMAGAVHPALKTQALAVQVGLGGHGSGVGSGRGGVVIRAGGSMARAETCWPATVI